MTEATGRNPGDRAGGRDPLPELRRMARQILSLLGAGEREAIIIKCWMSHDARWFTAAAKAFGLEAAMRLNREAIREEGRIEARRLVRRLGLPEVRTAFDYLLFQEVAIGLLGPELLDYSVAAAGEDGFDLQVEHCFAFDNVSRAGIAAQYECGIIPRLQGWLDELNVSYKLAPEPAGCLKAQGQECIFAFRAMRPGVGQGRTA